VAQVVETNGGEPGLRQERSDVSGGWILSALIGVATRGGTPTLGPPDFKVLREGTSQCECRARIRLVEQVLLGMELIG
jgi:hypothetical protein